MNGDPTQPSPRRGALLFGLMLLAPILAICGMEFGLRLAGFGSGYPLFVEAPGMPGYRQVNPELIRRYYDRAPELAVDAIPFRDRRRPGSYRIVIQGGSTAAGFPYGRWAGLAGMLGDRLNAAFPDREIEVVTTAMSAVNSNTLRDLVDEIIAVEPDAVLVYAGHNEFLGILGAASSLAPVRTPGVTRAYLALRRLRLYQLAQSVLAALRATLSFRGAASPPERSPLMAAAAAGALVPIGSPLYQRGVAQFAANLDSLLARYREAGIPVYVGTLASNLKDQPPFSSGIATGADREAREALWRDHRRAVEAGEPARSGAALRSLLAADDGDADAWYALGQLELAAGEAEAARDAFTKAKDRDQLRFRAPEAFNARIRELAARHAATVVDVQRKLEQSSPDGIVGDELMLEHLHPNAEGYFLLADAYFDSLRSAAAIGPWSGAASRERARRDMPLTAIDRILAQRTIAELEAGYPFADPPRPVRFPAPATAEERLAVGLQRGEIPWLEAMDALLQHTRRSGRTAEALVVARVAAESSPTLAAPNFVAGRLYLEAGEYRRSRRYLARSLAASPDDPATLQALIRAERGLGDEAAAARHRARLRALAGASGRAPAAP